MQTDVQAELKRTTGAKDASLHNADVAGGPAMWPLIVYSKQGHAQIVEKMVTAKLRARRRSKLKHDPTLPMEVSSRTMVPKLHPEERSIHLGDPKSPLRGVLGIRLIHQMEVIIRREDRDTLVVVPRHIVQTELI